jgi:CubicO group peptidase (beta-lactamase class C family)
MTLEWRKPQPETFFFTQQGLQKVTCLRPTGSHTAPMTGFCFASLGPSPLSRVSTKPTATTNYYLLSCIIHRITGKAAEEFIRERLFAPIGVKGCAWANCPKGEISGATGLYINTRDMAKLGVVCIGKGVYEGKRLLSEEWCKEAATEHLPEWGYGILVREGHFAFAGAKSQRVLVYPGKGLVLAGRAYADSFDYAEMLQRGLEASGF